MSAAVKVLRKTAGSLIAPSFSWLFGMVVTTKRFFAAIEDPDVPFGIKLLATSTVTGSVEPLTLLR